MSFYLLGFLVLYFQFQNYHYDMWRFFVVGVFFPLPLGDSDCPVPF